MSLSRSLTAWQRAWEAAMAEAGYPNARLETYIVEYEDGYMGINYGWNHDHDLMVESGLVREDLVGDNKKAWHDAHIAFLIVDELRPDEVEVSVALQAFLNAVEAHRNGDI